jgi:hypothetical protein
MNLLYNQAFKSRAGLFYQIGISEILDDGYVGLKSVGSETTYTFKELVAICTIQCDNVNRMQCSVHILGST